MATKFISKRNFNVLDESICKKFNIIDVELINNKEDDDYDENDLNSLMYKIHEDMYGTKLYEFTMNGIRYKEYISQKIFSGGNYFEDVVDFIEIEKEEPSLVTFYYGQGYECPICGKWETRVFKNNKGEDIVECLHCKHFNVEEFFEGKYELENENIIKLKSFFIYNNKLNNRSEILGFLGFSKDKKTLFGINKDGIVFKNIGKNEVSIKNEDILNLKECEIISNLVGEYIGNEEGNNGFKKGDFYDSIFKIGNESYVLEGKNITFDENKNFKVSCNCYDYAKNGSCEHIY